jgi:hypothetical protein
MNFVMSRQLDDIGLINKNVTFRLDWLSDFVLQAAESRLFLRLATAAAAAAAANTCKNTLYTSNRERERPSGKLDNYGLPNGTVSRAYRKATITHKYAGACICKTCAVTRYTAPTTDINIFLQQPSLM